MAIRIEFEQEDSQWLKWRSEGIGGSDAAAILGVSPWMSRHELWQLKTGRAIHSPPNAAMLRGRALEPTARVCLEMELGEEFEPAYFEHEKYPFLRASVDGVSQDGLTLAEIKCPGTVTLEMARDGIVPPHYMAQMQHYMMVTNAERCIYYAYSERGYGHKVEVPRDADYIQSLFEEELAFWKEVQEDRPPELSSDDYVTIDDPEWLAAADSYKIAYQNHQEAKKELDKWKKRLTELSDDGNCKGGGVRLTRVEREGSVDYSEVIDWMQDLAAEKGLDIKPDLGAFRKPQVGYVKISIERRASERD